jgi:hypothetical protein
MTNEQQLKLQAFFDDELPPAEAREIASLIARDRGAADMLRALKAARQALSGFEAGVRLPESREFYWSKIRREIERVEPSPASAPVVRDSIFARLRRLLVPATGLALIFIAGLVALRDGDAGAISEVETAVADNNAFTYRDYSSGTTLVWLSYPAEQEPGEDAWMSVLD